jgi:heat shock protein HslJ
MDVTFLRRLTWIPLCAGLAACSGSGEVPFGPTTPGGGSAASGSGPAASELQGLWKLERLAKAGQAPIELSASDHFSAEFTSDRVLLVADCNRCTGSYTAGAGTLSVGPMACTRAYCQSAPLDIDFAMLVGGAEHWLTTGDQLALQAANGVLLLRR